MDVGDLQLQGDPGEVQGAEIIDLESQGRAGAGWNRWRQWRN